MTNKDGVPAWKRVQFIDTQAPKNTVFKWGGDFKRGDFARQIDNTFGEGFFKKSTEAYDTQVKTGSKRDFTKEGGGKTIKSDLKIALLRNEALIENPKATKKEIDDYVSKRAKRFNITEVHHPDGVGVNPYKTEPVFRYANRALETEVMQPLKAGNIDSNEAKFRIDKINKNIGPIRVKLDDGYYGNFKNTQKSIIQSAENFKSLSVNELRPLANIGCPNKKADGGRVNFANGEDLVACAIKGAEKLQNTNPKKLDGLAKSNIKTLTKPAQGARFLKNVLGPGALAFEGLFALPFAALDFAEGRAGSDILKNALSLGLMDNKLRQDELKEFFAGAGKGEEFISALESVKNLSKQLSGTERQRQRAIPKYNIAFDNFETAMQPFMRVNPQLEAGQMFSPELLDENLRKTEEAKQKVLETYDERLKERGIGPYAKPFDFSYGEFSNGGIAGLSGGDKSGPPPERGPDSEGLRSLMKRGINL